MLVVQTHPFCWVQIQGGHSNGTRVFKGCTIDMWPTSPGFSNAALIKSNKPLGVAAGSRNHIFEVIDPNLIPNFHDPANSIFGSTGLLISAILTEVTRAFVSTWPPNAAAVTLESSRPWKISLLEKSQFPQQIHGRLKSIGRIVYIYIYVYYIIMYIYIFI